LGLFKVIVTQFDRASELAADNPTLPSHHTVYSPMLPGASVLALGAAC
jgi:hypothetical protein